MPLSIKNNNNADIKGSTIPKHFSYKKKKVSQKFNKSSLRTDSIKQTFEH